MIRSVIRIPESLDEQTVMGLLRRLNLLATGQTSFHPKEVHAALHWARIPFHEAQRFMHAMDQHALFSEPSPVPPRVPARLPLLNLEPNRRPTCPSTS